MRRLSAVLTLFALLGAGCAGGPDADRAQQLLQTADAKQRALSSMEYRARMGMSIQGQKLSFDLYGAAVLKGADAGDQWIRVTIPQLPGLAARGDVTFVIRDGEMTMNVLGSTQPMPMPTQPTDRAAPGSLASLQLARCVEDVRVAEDSSFHGEPASRVAGVVDTSCVLEVVDRLAGSGAFGERGLDLDELGAEVGDVRATLFVSKRSQLLIGGLLSFSIEAEGEKATLDLSYRLTSTNRPVRFPF